jgi:hypothetical protein
MCHRETVRRGGVFCGSLALFCAVTILGTLALGAIPCSAEEGHGFEVRGEVLEAGGNVSAGGAFAVTGERVIAGNGIDGGEFALVPQVGTQAKATGGCPCQQEAVFDDGFESGGLGAWSSSVGN